MKRFLTKHKELIRYIMFGCCTTLVNWLVHFVFVALIPAAKTNQVLNTAATVLAWIIAVLFAFFTYKRWVFENRDWDLKSVFAQMVKFFGARMVTLGTDALMAYFLTQPLNDWAFLRILPIVGDKDWLPLLVLKVLQGVVNLIVNYLLSKFVVFRKRRNE